MHPDAQVHGWRKYSLYSGSNLWRIKNDSSYVAVDDSGTEVDPFPIIDEDRVYRHSLLGGMTENLAERILEYPDKEVVISIFPRTMRPRNFVRASDEATFLSQREDLGKFCAESVAPLVTLLTEIGAPPIYVARTTPFVLAQLTPMQIHIIKSNQYIDVIDIFHETVAQYDGDIFSSSKTSKLDALQDLASGGFGEVVATIEKGRARHGPSGAAEPYSLLWQSGATLGASINRDNLCADFDDHAGWVAGFISAANLGTGERSGAPAARVVVGNTCLRVFDPDSLVDRYKAADDITWFGVDKAVSARIYPRIMNHSYGDDDAAILWGGGAWMRAIDFRAKYFIQTETVACGNHGLATMQKPNGGSVACRSYNSLNVGGYDDLGTLSWGDDKYYKAYPPPFPIVMTTGAWFNDFGAGSDREQPEIAAPAVLLRSTEQSDGTAPNPDRMAIGGLQERRTGTSFAAPLVAGLSALVHEVDLEIKWTPIAMKALLLATSRHPINGEDPPDFSAPKIGGNYTADLRVGAGAVVGETVRDTLDGSSGKIQTFDTVNSFWSPSSAGGWRYLQNSQPQFVPVIQTGKRTVRVAVAWYADSPCRLCLATVPAGHNDETWFGEYWGLPTDIDLEVSDANGNLVSRSISFDNNYEIIQFETANRSQPFRIHIKAFEGGMIKNETIAVAWAAWDP